MTEDLQFVCNACEKDDYEGEYPQRGNAMPGLPTTSQQ